MCQFSDWHTNFILNKTLVIENDDSWETGTRPLAVESVRGYSTFIHKKSNGFRHFQTQQLHLYFGCKQSTGSDVCSVAAWWFIRNRWICLWLGRMGSSGWWYFGRSRSYLQTVAGRGVTVTKVAQDPLHSSCSCAILHSWLRNSLHSPPTPQM